VSAHGSFVNGGLPEQNGHTSKSVNNGFTSPCAAGLFFAFEAAGLFLAMGAVPGYAAAQSGFNQADSIQHPSIFFNFESGSNSNPALTNSIVLHEIGQDLTSSASSVRINSKNFVDHLHGERETGNAACEAEAPKHSRPEKKS
jgi:hypothetical protein